MTKKMKQLTIRRSKWVRGDKGGEARLLNHDGNMCCLGFAACQIGGKRKSDMLGIRMPAGLFRGKSFLTNVTPEGDIADNELAYDASGINDKCSMSEKMREYKLRILFRKHGIAVTFVD